VGGQFLEDYCKENREDIKERYQRERDKLGKGLKCRDSRS
jgi:hypothetical protein